MRTYAEWRHYRTCRRKLAWASERLAANFATLQRWRNPSNPPQRPYECDFCGEWHLTKHSDDDNPPPQAA